MGYVVDQSIDALLVAIRVMISTAEPLDLIGFLRLPFLHHVIVTGFSRSYEARFRTIPLDGFSRIIQSSCYAKYDDVIEQPALLETGIVQPVSGSPPVK